MATKITVTYQLTLVNASKDHAKGVTASATIKRTSPSSLDTVGLSVNSATIDLSGVTFYSGSGNNPYLDIGDFGRVSVPSSITDKSAMAFTVPSGFSLDNLLDVGTSESDTTVYAYKSTNGNVVHYSSSTESFTITAICTQNYTKSTATVTSSVEAGSASTVTISNSNLSKLYHIVKWIFGDSSYSVTLSKGKSSASYVIPVTWLANIPSASSGTAKVKVTTYNTDDVSLGTNTYSFTIIAGSSAVPSISLAYTRIDNTVPSSWGVYVQGKSGITITATASGYQGSTISSYTISGGASKTQTSNVFTISTISSSGTVSFTVKAKDSRGKTASATVSISVQAYSAPKLTQNIAFRSDSAGVASETGTYISAMANGSCSSVSGKNSVSFTAQYALSESEAYSPATTLTAGEAAIIGSGEILTSSSYKVKFTATDALGSVSTVVYVGTTAYTVFFREGGNGIAIGKTSERNNALEISPDWDIYHGTTKLDDTVPISRGGTGQTTLSAAREALNIKSVSVSNITDSTGYSLDADATTSVSITMTRDGYEFLGIIGIKISSNVTRINVLSYRIYSTYVLLYLKNLSTSTVSTGDIVVKGIYREE